LTASKVTMKNNLFLALLICVSATANAQYYYADIIGTRQTNQQYKVLRAFESKKINATSFDARNEPQKDFVLEQVISPDGRKITTRSATIGISESYFIGYYQNNRVVKTVDSSRNALNTTNYVYDNTGKVSAVSTSNKDFDGTFNNTEAHYWSYNEKAQPATMLKVKNGVDTTVVTFKYDEEDNLSEEIWKKNNRTIETYYYYYNPKKQLTDIVRFSRKAKTLLPDYLFEYDNAGRISQMTQTQSGSANYLVWRYNYNENGMKVKEVVYNKQKEFLGKIEYNYQ
jgi:YD repeat-containing protein